MIFAYGYGTLPLKNPATVLACTISRLGPATIGVMLTTTEVLMTFSTFQQRVTSLAWGLVGGNRTAHAGSTGRTRRAGRRRWEVDLLKLRVVDRPMYVHVAICGPGSHDRLNDPQLHFHKARVRTHVDKIQLKTSTNGCD